MKKLLAGDGTISLDDASQAGSGAPAFEGFLYQVDVSVWTALDLILAKKLADAVELEPCSQEDIEAQLPDTDPGPASLGAAAGQKLLVIQAKLRSGEPWSVKAIIALLKHGGPKRVSAKDRLKDSQVHYLLVTSAPLAGVAIGLRVRNFGQWPDAECMPPSLKKALHPGAAGRVAVLANEETDRIEQRIKDLLTDAFRVPHSKWRPCLEKLRLQARGKMTGRIARTWHHDELKETVKSFDGYFASSPELNHYVRPTNWGLLCKKLDEQHAIVITGRSGTGKTMAAEALWDHMRRQIPGLERVAIHRGPGEVRVVQRSGPVLFDIEDPWGRYRFEPGSEEWNDKLPEILHLARADRLFVITTRDDVLFDAKAEQATSPWRVLLEAEHYGNAERKRLYETRISVLPRTLQTVAIDHSSRVLGVLETPLEIQKFFDALATITDDEAMRGLEKVLRAIDEAHQGSIEVTIATQVKARSALHWAAVIWGLLKANAKLSRELMPEIQARLASRKEIFERGFEELVNFMVAGRSLRQVGSAVSYYHPRVEAALEHIIVVESIYARSLLQHLCDVLLTFDEGKADDWGRHAAARLVVAGASLDALRFRANPAAQIVLDKWLVAKLGHADDKFPDNLRLAARVGSDQCALAELARFLVDKAPQQMFSTQGWKPLEEPSEWYEKVSADPMVKSVCDTFVRQVLPFGSENYPSDISTHLVRLAGNLTPAFIDAASMIVKHGFNSNIDAIANGALVDLDGFSLVAKAALDYWESREEDLDNWRETALRIKNGEYNDDYADYLMESAGEDGYSAGELLEAYVAHLRLERDWRAVHDHPDIARLLRWWLDLVRKKDANPLPDPLEVEELVGKAFDSPYEEMLWELVRLHWRPMFETLLVKRIVAGHQNSDVRVAAAACFAVHVPQCFVNVRDRLITVGDVARLLGLFEDLSDNSYRRRHRGPDFLVIASQWIQDLDGPYRELVAPFTQAEAERNWSLTSEGVELARKLIPADDPGRITKIRFGIANGFSVDAEVQHLLTNCEDATISVAAMDAAVAVGQSDLVYGGLRHRLGRVRACALVAVASRTQGSLPTELLEMAKDKSRYVREALIQLLANRLVPEYVDTLIILAADTWSSWSSYQQGDGKFTIARAAAECLSNMPKLLQPAPQTIIDLAKGCEDWTVRRTLFRAVATNASLSDREELLRIALSPGREVVRVDAALALMQASDHIEAELVAKIEPDHLVKIPENVAAVLAVILGFRGTELAVDATAVRLAGIESRMVFLVLLGMAVVDRNKSMARTIGQLLPVGHVAKSLIAGTIEGLLPRSALDDLGDVRAIREVLWLLSEKFEPEPKNKDR